jgi:mutator protein MutT
MASGVIEVAAGLVEREGCILITQRKPGSHLAGLWEFPGGKRDPAESWEDCLVRELREELAITVTVGPLRHETVHRYPEKTVHLRFYAATLASGEPEAIECAAIAWVRPADLPKYAFPEADRELVALLSR